MQKNEGKKLKRPATLWLLIFLLVFLSFGGFFGGISMLVDPTGSTLGMEEVLPLLPVSDFILPGLFLIVVMGIVPLALVYGLIWKPGWEGGDKISGRSGYYWAWTGTITLGVVLILWLAVQGLLIGFAWAIQYITLANGLLIIFVSLLPDIRRFYKQ
jgi:hypothetical protein